MDNTSIWLEKNSREIIIRGYSKRSLENYNRAVRDFLEYINKDPITVGNNEELYNKTHTLF